MNTKIGVTTGRRARTVIPVLLILFIFTAGIFAESPEILTLEKAVELTLKNNQDLLINSNSVLSSKSIFQQTKRNFLPDLDLSGSFSRSYYKSADDEGDYYNADSSVFSLSLSSSLTLFNGFFNVSEKAKAFSQYESARNAYSRTEQTVIYQTILNYLDVVLSGELIRVGNENLNTQKLLLTRIKDFFQAGKKASVDVHYQNAEIASTEYQLINYKQELQLAKVKLLEDIGITSDLDFSVVPVASGHVLSLEELEKMDLRGIAVENRGDLKAAEFNRKAAEQGVRSARSGYYPKVSLFGEVSSRYTSLSSGYSFSNQLWDNNPTGAIGVSVSLPVFDKGSTRDKVTRAKLDMDNSRIEKTRILNGVWADLINAESTYRTALRQVEVAEAKLEYSKATLDSMTERYNVNAATISELSQSRAQYQQARYDQVDAKLNLYRQGIALFYQMGDVKGMLSQIK